MLGSVEVLDYKKSFDEWDHKDIFPVSLTLGGRGSFYHPLQLNLADPIVTGMQLTFNEVFKNDYFHDEFEINLNKDEDSQGNFIYTFLYLIFIIKIEKESLKFLLEFNKLVRQIDFGASKDWFVKQIMNAINYVDQENKRLFNQVDLNVQWIAEISSKPGFILKTNPLHNYPSLQNSLIDKSSSIVYYLSQDSPDFSISDLKKIHHVYHYDPTVSLQFSIKISYKYQNRRKRSSIRKEKAQQLMSDPLEIVYQDLEPNIQQLKDQLFNRLEKQGVINEIPRENNNNDDISLENEYQQREKDLIIRPGKFMAQIRRFLKMIRYFALGYRHWILQKYILTVTLLLLLVLDLV